MFITHVECPAINSNNNMTDHQLEFTITRIAISCICCIISYSVCNIVFDYLGRYYDILFYYLRSID